MAREQIERVKGLFSAQPENFPSGAATGAAVIGNGDVLVAIFIVVFIVALDNAIAVNALDRPPCFFNCPSTERAVSAVYI